MVNGTIFSIRFHPSHLSRRPAPMSDLPTAPVRPTKKYAHDIISSSHATTIKHIALCGNEIAKIRQISDLDEDQKALLAEALEAQAELIRAAEALSQMLAHLQGADDDAVLTGDDAQAFADILEKANNPSSECLFEVVMLMVTYGILPITTPFRLFKSNIRMVAILPILQTGRSRSLAKRTDPEDDTTDTVHQKVDRLFLLGKTFDKRE